MGAVVAGSQADPRGAAIVEVADRALGGEAESDVPGGQAVPELIRSVRGLGGVDTAVEGARLVPVAELVAECSADGDVDVLGRFGVSVVGPPSDRHSTGRVAVLGLLGEAGVGDLPDRRRVD